MSVSLPSLPVRELSDNWLHSPQEQSALLRRIVDRIRGSLELKVVLQTAVDEIAALLDLQRCYFFWCFEDTQRVQVVCERLLEDGRESLLGYYALSDFGMWAEAIARGQLVGQPGTPESRSWGVSSLLGGSLADYLLLPVRGQDNSLGYLVCLRESACCWLPGEVAFLQAIAQQLEIAIQHAQLYEQVHKQAQRERIVNQITSQTRQSFDLETILTQAIVQLRQALAVDRCIVHLVELEGEPDLSVNDDDSTAQDPAFRRKHLYESCHPDFPTSVEDFDTHGPITQWVVQHRRRVVIANVDQDERIGPDNEEYCKAQIRSSLVVPVQTREALYAILYLNQCSRVRFWSMNDQKLAQAVADQLAVSIQQAYLYAQIRQQAAESASQAAHLKATLQELRATQAQLIQSEKMSGLGRMVAGLAHEVNNPVTFIYGNVPYIDAYLQDLVQLVKGYREACPNPPPALRALEEDVDVDFLVRDSQQILTSIRIGAERIRQIILSLRNFSRLDESHRKLVDVHEGLESTLCILRDRLERVEVVRQYGELPRVECYPKQLNQVFMNLLMNAIEALETQPERSGRIDLRTELVMSPESHRALIRIAIADNGPGIPADIQPKIFDPFFTTKEIGQGTGLGLAICYQTVVTQHRGNLTIQSLPSQGTEAIIELPVRLVQAIAPRQMEAQMACPDAAVSAQIS